MNRSRTVRSFRLNGQGVLYYRKSHSVFVSFHKNEIITLYIVTYHTSYYVITTAASRLNSKKGGCFTEFPASSNASAS